MTDTFDPTTATADEINAEYQRQWAENIASHGVSNGWDLPKPVRWGLTETLRKWWIAWYDAGEAREIRNARLERAEHKRKLFEQTYGVSDKAPPKKEPAVRPATARGPAAGTDAPPEPTRARTSPRGPAGAATDGSRGRAAGAKPRVSRSPEPAPMDFGDGEDVDRAVRALFGHGMEDS